MFSKVEPVFKSSKISNFSLQSPPHWHKAERLSCTCTVLCTLFCSCSIVAPWVNCQPQAELSIRVSSYSSIGIRAGMICFTILMYWSIFIAIIISAYWECNWLGNVAEGGIRSQHTIFNKEAEGKWRNCIHSKNLHEPWPLHAYR